MIDMIDSYEMFMSLSDFSPINYLNNYIKYCCGKLCRVKNTHLCTWNDFLKQQFILRLILLVFQILQRFYTF